MDFPIQTLKNREKNALTLDKTFGWLVWNGLDKMMDLRTPLSKLVERGDVVRLIQIAVAIVFVGKMFVKIIRSHCWEQWGSIPWTEHSYKHLFISRGENSPINLKTSASFTRYW